MYINLVADYIPKEEISNDYFLQNFGILPQEIESKSGIRCRRIASCAENTNTMAAEATRRLSHNLPYPITDTQLIIGATYTPYDTVGTLAHYVQKTFNVSGAKCFCVSSACSSFANSLEIVDCFIKCGKISKALIVVSENNSVYNVFSNEKSGFLWGDAAAAVFVSDQEGTTHDFKVLDIITTGLGNVGKSTDAVYLRPYDGGLAMPYGKDVFLHACNFIMCETKKILERNKLAISDINFFIPHQANARITEYVTLKLGIDPGKVLSNIEFLGNTGAASTPILLSQNRDKFKKNDIVVISVFGGGYSSGAVLLKKT